MTRIQGPLPWVKWLLTKLTLLIYHQVQHISQYQTASLVTPMATSEDQNCLLGGDGKVDQTPPHTPERQREHGLTKYLSFFSSDCHIVL